MLNRNHFWLADAQFARIEPHMPGEIRGKPRADDRWMISRIVQVLKSGGRWIDAPPDYGPPKILHNRYVSWAAKGVWTHLFHVLANAGGPPAQMLIDSSAVKAHRSASGGKGAEQSPAIGRLRGGPTFKIHALTDRHCRPIACLLTSGHVAECTAAAALLKQMPPAHILHGDKGYDSNAVRRQAEQNGIMPNIPPKALPPQVRQSY